MSRKRPRRGSSVGGGDDDDIFCHPTFFEEESVSVSKNCENDNVPDFDSFEDQQEAQPQPPSFVTTHCIFCKTDCVAKFIVVNGVLRKVKCEEDLEGGSSSIAVKRQLKSLFIIRNILGVKKETCYKLLNDYEGQLHPELWINVCNNCDARVKEIARLERRSKTIVLDFKRAIWESHNNGRGGGGDNDNEEEEETDFDGVWKEIRLEALLGFDPNQNQPETVIVKVEQDNDLKIMIFMILMVCVLFGEDRGRTQNPDVEQPLPTSSSSPPHSPLSPETATGSSEPLEAAATTSNQKSVTDDIQQTAVESELHSTVGELKEGEKGTLSEPILSPPIHVKTNGEMAASSLTEVLTSESSSTQVVTTNNGGPSSELVNSPKPIATNAKYNLRTRRHKTLGRGRTFKVDFVEPIAVSNELNLPVADAPSESPPSSETATVSSKPLEATTTETSLEIITDGILRKNVITEVRKLERKRAMWRAASQRRNVKLRKEPLNQPPAEDEQERERMREYWRVKARLREEKRRQHMTEEDFERRRAKWRAQRIKKKEMLLKRTEEEQRLAEGKKRAAKELKRLKEIETEKKRSRWRAQYAKKKENPSFSNKHRERMTDPVFAEKRRAQWRASNKRRTDRKNNKSKQNKSLSSASSKSTQRARANANNNRRGKSKVASTSSSPSSSASLSKRSREPQTTKSRRAGTRKSSRNADNPPPNYSEPSCSAQLTKLDKTRCSL